MLRNDVILVVILCQVIATVAVSPPMPPPPPTPNGGKCAKPGKPGTPCYGVGPCKNGAQCQSEADGTAKCDCKPGFLGIFCEKDIDECETQKPCGANSKCVNKPGTFECEGNPGYKPKPGSKTEFEDVDECETQKPCGANSKCVNKPGAFECEGNPGYKPKPGSKTEFEDIDECSIPNGCAPEATCTNAPGSFTCACKPGFEGDGKTCTAIPTQLPAETAAPEESGPPGGIVPPGPVVEVCHQKADLLFLVDYSGSISNKDWELEKKFLAHMIRFMDIGSDKVKVSVVLFAEETYDKFNFNEFQNKEELLKEVSQLSCNNCKRGKTNTAAALEYGRTSSLSDEMGYRPDAATVVVVLTDGQATGSQEKLKKQAENMKEMAIVVAVGAGGGIDEKELKMLASSDDLAFSSKKMDELEAITDKIAEKTCTATKDVPGDKPIVDAIPRGGCKQGWTYSESNKKCYRYFAELKTNEQAKALCLGNDPTIKKTLGNNMGLLAMPKTAAINTFISQLRPGKTSKNIKQPVWLGMKKQIKKSGWWIFGSTTKTTVFVDNQGLAGYKNFGKGEPNDGSGEENCFEMRSDGKWNDIYCDYYRTAWSWIGIRTKVKKSFICEQNP